jgi:hypothetical protein
MVENGVKIQPKFEEIKEDEAVTTVQIRIK